MELAAWILGFLHLLTYMLSWWHGKTDYTFLFLGAVFLIFADVEEIKKKLKEGK